MDVYAAHPYSTALRIEEAGDQICQRGFSAAGRSHKSDCLPGRNRKGDIFQNLLFSVIAEMHLFKLYRAVFRMFGMSCFFQRLQIQNAVNPL